jgi:hypothetical protein
LSFSCSFCFELLLALLYHFLGLSLFVFLLVLWLFLLLDNLLELFVGFWSFSCASWGLEFEIQTLCFLLSLDSSRRRLRNQLVSTIV